MQLSTFELNDTSDLGPPLSNTNKRTPKPQQPWTQSRNTLHVLESAGGVKCTWLVDTGSDITCVSSKLPGIEKLKLFPPQSIPAAANGSPLGCIGGNSDHSTDWSCIERQVRVLVIQIFEHPRDPRDRQSRKVCLLWHRLVQSNSETR